MKQLVDFIPVVLFFIVFKSYDDVQQGIMAATAVLIVATVIQLGWSYYRYRKIEKMPLIAAVLAVIFGGVTLVLQDEIYIKWKPTVANWLFAAAFAASQFVGQKNLVERMLGSTLQLPGPVWSKLNLAWVGFFLLMGVLNLYVAFNFDTSTWVDFKLFGVTGLALVFMVLQALFIARYVEPEAEPKHEE